MIVVDASVLAPALVDDGDDGDLARARLRGQTLTAPAIIDLEVVSVLRRLTGSGAVAARRAELALRDLVDLPLRRADHQPLLGRCWQLRQTVTAYDAAYIALAEALDLILVTADARLARAPGVACPVDLLGRPGRGQADPAGPC